MRLCVTKHFCILHWCDETKSVLKKMEGAHHKPTRHLLPRSLVNYILFLWLISTLSPHRRGSAQQRYHSHGSIINTDGPVIRTSARKDNERYEYLWLFQPVLEPSVTQYHMPIPPRFLLCSPKQYSGFSILVQADLLLLTPPGLLIIPSAFNLQVQSS